MCTNRMSDAVFEFVARQNFFKMTDFIKLTYEIYNYKIGSDLISDAVFVQKSSVLSKYFPSRKFVKNFYKRFLRKFSKN